MHYAYSKINQSDSVFDCLNTKLRVDVNANFACTFEKEIVKISVFNKFGWCHHQHFYYCLVEVAYDRRVVCLSIE